ncbi:MAG: hypothetical protein ACFFDK_11520 [Promethearchaeota archaeon]
MDEKVNQEALELVQHALSLLDLKLYDDCIEILRKAIRLYQQINNEVEINALRKKIAEIYTTKEHRIGVDTIKDDLEKKLSQNGATTVDTAKGISNTVMEQNIPEKISTLSPENLIEEAKTLVKMNKFEEALSKYDEIINILNENNRSSEVENIYKLIEECYVSKTKFLREPKKEHAEVEMEADSKDSIPSSDVREEKIIIHDADTSEIETERMRAVEERFKKEFEDKELQRKITEMVNRADKMAREYESQKIRALKNGKFEDPCVYPDVIVMYEEVRRLLAERGWIEQAKIYANQVQIYKEKLEKDIKIRELEAMKAEKDKEFEDLMRTGKVARELKEDSQREERLKAIEAKLKKDFEVEKFQNFITETVANTEKMVRNYELEIKKGNFQETCPYQQVIEIYTEIRQKLIDRGWMDQVDIYTSQIKIYQEKLEQDQKLRAVEAQKKQKEAEYLQTMKLQQKDDEKLKALDEKILSKYQSEIEDAKFQNLVTSLVEEADKMERDYESKKKRAIKEKKLLELEAPYSKIIEIYERLRDMLLEKGWKDQASIYVSQIQVYTEKYERDKILRDIEAHKLQK